MEAAALNTPPAPPPEWLERIVLAAIPPAAREAVGGDLWETYQAPRQYVAEALRTVPLVILSQARRNLNFPALMLQGALSYSCLGTLATLALLPILMLLGAYQATARPAPRRAFRESILMAAFVTIVLLQLMTMHIATQLGLEHFNWLSLFLQALLLSPLLCLFRAGLILLGDRRTGSLSGAIAMEKLEQDYRAFAGRARRRNLAEGAALALAAACCFYFGWNLLPVRLFGLVGLYLLLHAAPRALPARGDFVSLRAQYQQELARQQQLRQFLWWLWFTPALVALNAGLIQAGLASGRPLIAVMGAIGVALLCFLVTALNREHGGRVQEQIGLLDRMREAMMPETAPPAISLPSSPRWQRR